jgi:serine phosphatase RsbU (regulator of sigma subunit)
VPATDRTDKQPYTTAADSERISRVVFQYGARIWRERDKAAQLATVADMARDLVGADRCSIWLKDPQTQELYTRVSHGLKEIRVAPGHGIVGTCVVSGEASVVNDTSTDPRFLSTVDRDSGYHTHSILTVPMRGTTGDVIGACQVLNKPGGFMPADIDLLYLAASFSAEAIENQELQSVRESARRLQMEIEVARDVQFNLLPKSVPPHEGVECAGLCKPALRVGGDYYNFWSLPSGNFAIALGDVSGKGIPAALLMASIQASLQGFLSHPGTSPAGIVEALSRVVYENSSTERYSTLFFAQYDTHAHTLTYVNAGQVLPVKWSANKATKLDAGGPPIGLLPSVQYDQETVPFHPGDCLVCFSDGVTESMNAEGDEWGEDNLILELPQSATMSAQALAAHLVKSADAFANGAPQHDDMTVVILQAKA